MFRSRSRAGCSQDSGRKTSDGTCRAWLSSSGSPPNQDPLRRRPSRAILGGLLPLAEMRLPRRLPCVATLEVVRNLALVGRTRRDKLKSGTHRPRGGVPGFRLHPSPSMKYVRCFASPIISQWLFPAPGVLSPCPDPVDPLFTARSVPNPCLMTMAENFVRLIYVFYC